MKKNAIPQIFKKNREMGRTLMGGWSPQETIRIPGLGNLRGKVRGRGKEYFFCLIHT